MDKKNGQKKWTWVLIVIVTGLWVYNIYNTVKTFHTDDSEIYQPETYASNLTLNLKKDTFFLILPERDPFLDKSNLKIKATNQNILPSENSQKPKTVDIPKKVVKKEWPKIKYYGFVKNRSQNHTLCVVGIDKKIYKVSAGDVENEVTIVQSYADSIELSFQGELRNFYK